ncbi:MAG: ATP synthase F1 subunit delta [Deltaproteobacteria bacterium]|nr:ATP synthase F1 subunit delta [Deltaproteobacteria bacterium]
MAARGSAAAERYARALFGLARDQDRVDAVGQELATVIEAMRQVPALRDVLLRPLHPATERRAALRAVGERLGLSPLLQHFGSFLIDQRRTRDLEAIHDCYQRLAEEAAGRVRGELVSAAPLESAQLERLRAALAQRTGRSVDLEVRVDPALLGGVVARVGDLVFDGSLRTQLAQLRASLTGER